MGNSTGKVLGVVAGAGLQLIPGVGTVAGIAILAGTMTAGSVVDAVVENNKQKSDNDRIARETQEANERRIREEQERAQREQAEQARQLRHAQAQMELINIILAACRTGEISQVPNYLGELDNDYFYNTLGQQPVAESVNPDVRERIQEMLRDDQDRRNLNFENPRPGLR